MDLSERQELILRTVIECYVRDAHPVGSAAIVNESGLNVSSATVRNDLALLEHHGYVRQLHTSGGRVPTDAGYRYYVERLMRDRALPHSEAMTIRRQFQGAHPELQEWMQLAASIIAARMRTVGLVTAPKAAEVRLRHLEVIGIHDMVALLIVVLQDGTVLQEMMTLDVPRAQEELSPMADRLSRQLQGLSAAEVEAKRSSLPEPDATVTRMAADLLRRGERPETQVYHAGLAEMIRQPEFLEPRPGEPASLMTERLRQMVEFLQQGAALQHLLASLPQAADIQVVIGGPGPRAGLQDYSFVLGRYGSESDSLGYLGVIGPTRMEYPRAIALVRYMSDLMTDLVQAY